MIKFVTKLVTFLVYWIVKLWWRFRSGFAPFVYVLLLVLFVRLYEDLLQPWWAAMTVASVLALATWFGAPSFARFTNPVWLYLNPWATDDGTHGVLMRDTARVFLCTLMIVTGTWISYRIDQGSTPETILALQIGALALASMWWYYHGWRRRKPLNKYAMRWRRISESELPELKGWKRSKVVGIDGNRKNPVLIIRLKGGRTIATVGGTAGNVASAQNLRPGAVTIMPDPKVQARVRVRIVPRDPWGGVLLHPLPAIGTRSLSAHPRCYVGKYEDAQRVTMKLQQHMLIVGMSGSGKSVFLESLLAWILSYDDAIIVGADLASGATFGIYEDVFAAPLATNVAEAEILLARIFQEITFREQLLAQKKKSGELIDVLPTSPEFPAIFVPIDEFPDLIKAGGPQVLMLLERFAAKGRKVNVWLILGAQNPTAKDVGSTELRGQTTATIGLGLSERQSRTLWESGMSEGWNSTPLLNGTFLLRDRDPSHNEPRVAKGLFIPPKARLELIRRASKRPNMLNSTTHEILTGGQSSKPIGATARTGQYWTPDDLVTEIEQAPALVSTRRTTAEIDETVYTALPRKDGIGPLSIMEKTDFDRATVNRSLKRLLAKRRAWNTDHGKWVQM